MRETSAWLQKAGAAPADAAVSSASAFSRSEVLYAVAFHGIADAIHDAGGELGCLALGDRLSGSDPRLVCEYMYAASAFGLLKRLGPDSASGASGHQEVGRYALEVPGHLLRASLPASDGGLREYALLMAQNVPAALRALGDSLVGRPGQGNSAGHQDSWTRVFGERYFPWIARHGRSAHFDAAMQSLAPHQVSGLLAGWSPPHASATVCDVAGGKGILIGEMMRRHRGLKGVLLDLAATAGAAKAHLASLGPEVASRVRVVDGNIFDPLPADLSGCDVFLLKMILHDWPDAESEAVLRNIKSTSRPGARLDVVDMLIGATGTTGLQGAAAAALGDVAMLATHAGKERTLAELRLLLAGAGVTQSALRVTRLQSHLALVQAVL